MRALAVNMKRLFAVLVEKPIREAGISPMLRWYRSQGKPPRAIDLAAPYRQAPGREGVYDLSPDRYPIR
jgi:hypothetical protein